MRATFRPVLRAVRATLRPVLRTVRAVLRAVRFVVAIVFLRFCFDPSARAAVCFHRLNFFAHFAFAQGKSIFI